LRIEARERGRWVQRAYNKNGKERKNRSTKKPDRGGSSISTYRRKERRYQDSRSLREKRDHLQKAYPIESPRVDAHLENGKKLQ